MSSDPMEHVPNLAASLAVLSERDLVGLRAAIDGFPNIVPGLLAFLDHAVGWEIDRRAGSSYRLQGPRAAIDDSEVDQSLIALHVLVAQFRGDVGGRGGLVADFFEVVAVILRAETEQPGTLQ